MNGTTAAADPSRVRALLRRRAEPRARLEEGVRTCATISPRSSSPSPSFPYV